MKLGWRPTSHQCLCSFQQVKYRGKDTQTGHRLRVCTGTGRNQNCRIGSVLCLGSCGYRRLLLIGHPHLWVRLLHHASAQISVQLGRAPHCSKGTGSSSLSISGFPSISVSHVHSMHEGMIVLRYLCGPTGTWQGLGLRNGTWKQWHSICDPEKWLTMGFWGGDRGRWLRDHQGTGML